MLKTLLIIEFGFLNFIWKNICNINTGKIEGVFDYLELF